MCGMAEQDKILKLENVRAAEYRFAACNSRVYITGVPLSGKSSVAPLIAGRIGDCTLQNMDILRLMAQCVEHQKPEVCRNPFVEYGSCDSYRAVGDGSYSDAALIEGYRQYSEAVAGAALAWILPKLETQGARDVIIEGVQLMPEIVKRHINDNTRLIVLTSSEDRLGANARKIFGAERWLMERYSPDKLLLLQDEILQQSERFPSDKIFVVDNTSSIENTACQVLEFLLSSGEILPR